LSKLGTLLKTIIIIALLALALYFYQVRVYQPPTGIINGYTFDDLDKDGIWDSNEPPIEGFQITLYNDDLVSPLLRVTDEEGYYEFDNLLLGTYRVEEEQNQKWTPTSPSSGTYETQLTEARVIQLNFGNYLSVASLRVIVYNDVNQNAEMEGVDDFLEGWRVTVYDEDGNRVGSPRTNNDGFCLFTDLQFGWYTVEVNAPAHEVWTQSFPPEGVWNIDIHEAGEYRVEFAYYEN
jgi:hypothetical protein